MTTNLPDIDLPPPQPQPQPQVKNLVTPPRPSRHRRSTFARINPLIHRFQPIIIALPTVPEDTVPQANLVSSDEFLEQQAVRESFEKIKQTRNIVIAYFSSYSLNAPGEEY